MVGDAPFNENHVHRERERERERARKSAWVSVRESSHTQSVDVQRKRGLLQKSTLSLDVHSLDVQNSTLSLDVQKSTLSLDQ